jgi:hypothetical protein
LSYDSFAAAAWRRNAKTPPNEPRIRVRTDQNVAGSVLVGVEGGFTAGFVGGELIVECCE